ncbi:class I SAM-dependent methyltransferase [Pusillimonas sp.]|uniref:class I SAM-dependent methyltransferase n=1 Tax=Pusillimonas sp. TaxID=3040095 RepID=UPI0039B84C4E
MNMARNTTVPAGLPSLDVDSASHLRAMQDYLAYRIQHTDDGFMPFEEWMQHALYAPGLGYYAAGSTKFGSEAPEGDFTTGPELTPLFGQALAGQVAQILAASGTKTVLEVGAGTGALAAALIPALNLLDIRPQYQILEVSGELRERQQQRLEGLHANVQWLKALPSDFKGCIIANEVLDAMPATLFRWDDAGNVLELGVGLESNGAQQNGAGADAGQPRFVFVERPADEYLQNLVALRMPPLPGYRSEINIQAEAWMRQLGAWLKKGAALLIDYGFPQREFYHPQRAEGTLMCHFRHHAHADPLLYPGLQDITTHVDFTAMADAALEGGLDILGYTSQARFLMNAGLIEILTGLDPHDAAGYAKVVGPVQKLLSEAEMGELFKVMAVGRGLDVPLMGFTSGDRRDRL